MNGFVHLHVHSEYSLLDGAARIEALATQAAANGMKALALTDHGVMYGTIAFYKACLKHGIKPIIGMEAYVTAGSRHERASRKEQPIYHLILLAKNKQGYRNLMKICSVGHLEGFHYKPRVDMETLQQYGEGIICLSACLGGEVSQHVLHDRLDEARAAAERYRDIFKDGFYLELQDHHLPEQKKVNIGLIALSEQTGIPLVATNDVHYIRQEDAAMQDVLICIGTGKTVEEEGRLRIPTDQLYFKSGDEMSALFRHVPEAILNTARIAEQCKVEIELGGAVLPAFEPIPEGLTAAQYLRQLCEAGLHNRYAHVSEWQDAAFQESAWQRLHYELDTIVNMGFADYFLIVWDFIRYAHEQGIMTGPGRGSSAGSLVAYTLRITNVDPLKYNLLFERFLNPERITMPDIDIDFNDERRDEVIAYVADKYGHDRVAQIITFGTMAARGAVRDVGRVLNVPYNETDRAAKLIPERIGITLEKALHVSTELREWREKQPRIRELLDMAVKVEGMPRHASTHAAGVVISQEPLTHYVPLQAASERSTLTQYSMEHLEAIGMLKMDFLGLRTLSIIERTLGWIEERTGQALDLNAVDDADEQTYTLLGRGETTGLFQLESAGVRRVLREMKPNSFEDIVSVLALYRPGPMEFIPNYILSKHGKQAVEYPHPDLEPILRDTYGIIVYQEQIMQIASRMAGFSLGEADLLRRAVSKKKREVLDQEREHFVQGSLAQGYAEAEANHVYDMIVRFADYGFPRAHAAAYGVLAFQTAFLKTHYPTPFMASMLTANMGNHRKVAEYIEDCRKQGIRLLPPDVNESKVTFTPVDGAIRFGLGAIKNVGTLAIESMLREREQKPFMDLLDFCKRVDLRVCNRRVIESLIQAGAFDSLPGHRAQLLAVLDESLEAAAKWRKEREDLQIQFLGLDEVNNWTVELPNVQPFTMAQQLELERDLLGLYLSGHPLDDYVALLAEIDTDQLVDLHDAADESECVVAGMVVSIRSIVTKAGKPMAFVEIEDRIERVEVVLFPEVWRRAEQLVAKGALLAVRAKVQQQDEDYKLLAHEAVPLEPHAVAALAQRSRQRRRPELAGDGGSSAGPKGRDSMGSSGSSGSQRSASVYGANRPAVARPSVDASSGHPSTRDELGAQQEVLRQAQHTAQQESSHKTQQRPTGRDAERGRVAESPGASSSAQPRSATQRVYIKITADRERPELLQELQQLIQSQPGPLPTVLFYEREQQLRALSAAYAIKPSPELFRRIEAICGAGTVRVK
ncbi:DNA polymerase III subunit alpha [Paenibacillus sp. 481]|uniref:DNA polymerase III subunit alpha n=1 Tax=Paenibacillus sp. 481 TaxID=2835869 RepID=UPI001E337ACB|nr:DNA polymerase III subunit alpha [Paenibacillus sp. 481]UHA72427.1 DNA polymerase III subunit alpha [Paenibacillus sp. 481]